MSAKPMLPKSFDLMSPVARDECVRRLRAKTESWWFPAIFGNKPVAGYVGDTSFRIYKRVAYSNPFRPRLSGELLDEDGQTRVRCRFRMSPFGVTWIAMWFGITLIGGGTFAILTIGFLLRGDALVDVWPFALTAIMPAAFGVAFVGLGLLAARNEPRFLRDFLRDTIVAREA